LNLIKKLHFRLLYKMFVNIEIFYILINFRYIGYKVF